MIKKKGPNAFNPVQQLLKDKVSRILNWQDLGLTEEDINKLTDEQRVKLWELANIKKRQLSAMDDDQNEKLQLDDKILKKSKIKTDDHNKAFEQDKELEKKWEKVEQEIEKQKSLAMTLERLQSHYQNTLPNLLLNKKEREQKVDKMRKDKELAKKQRAQALFLSRRQQFILQIQKEQDEKQKTSIQNQKDIQKKLSKTNQSFDSSIEQTPRFIESPRFQLDTEKNTVREIEDEIANRNMMRGKMVKMINQGNLQKKRKQMPQKQ